MNEMKKNAKFKRDAQISSDGERNLQVYKHGTRISRGYLSHAWKGISYRIQEWCKQKAWVQSAQLSRADGDLISENRIF